MLATLRHKLMNGKGIFMFFRSMMSSQLSTYVDFIVSFVLYAWVSFVPALAACCGSVAGGVVNCITNYKFTFKMKECSHFAIGVKFFLVWIGSLGLNSFGTEWLVYLLDGSRILAPLNMSADLNFAIARVTASLIVSVFWNFLLQRYFVFTFTKFDNFLDRSYYYLSALRDHNKK